MKSAGWTIFIYALLILIGGIMGHVMAASTTSLIMGIIFGAFLLLTAIGTWKDHLLPAYFGVLLILVLDGFFTYRFLYTLSFFPAGLMCLISLIALVLVVFFLRKQFQRKK